MKKAILSVFLCVACNPLFSTESWFIPAKIAVKNQSTPDTIWLDSRDKSAYSVSHLEGAYSLTWEELSEPNLPQKGNPLPQDRLVDIFQNLGISNDTLVLIYGDPLQGWGEEGRVAWTLRSLGHKKTYIVDGGFPYLKKLGAKITSKTPNKPARAIFIPTPKQSYVINKEEIKNSLYNDKYSFIDTREEREFIGGVPYGEARGGHLPGSKHIHFQEFLSKSGEILKPDQVRKLLESKGIKGNKTVVSYCTGGVRSGLVTAILESSGFHAVNYAGSMWEWSHLPEEQYPLVRGVK